MQRHMRCSDKCRYRGISKKDLSNFLRFAKIEYKLDVLESFLEATPVRASRIYDDSYHNHHNRLD